MLNRVAYKERTFYESLIYNRYWKQRNAGRGICFEIEQKDCSGLVQQNVLHTTPLLEMVSNGKTWIASRYFIVVPIFPLNIFIGLLKERRTCSRIVRGNCTRRRLSNVHFRNFTLCKSPCILCILVYLYYNNNSHYRAV